MQHHNLALRLSTFFIALAACTSLVGCPCNEPPEEARSCGGYKHGTECNACCGESNHLGVTVNDRCVCYEKPWEEYDYTPEGKTRALKPWEGKKPLVCEGREELTYKGVKAKLPGKITITAKDRCKLTLEDVDLDGKVAIRAEGRARVNVINSKLRGSGIGFEATERANVTMNDTDVRAPVGLKVSVRASVYGSEGSVKGKTFAIDVSDRGSVSLNGTEVKGETQKTGRKAKLDL